MTVTRAELASHLQAAFRQGPANRTHLLAYAVGSHARPEIIAAIARLPDKSYPTIHDVWNDLADVPAGL